MSSAFPLAFIGPQHFQAFKEMFGRSWPKTYQDWLARHSMEKIERERAGFTVQVIQIEPDELSHYAESYERAPSADMLSILAIEKAMDLSVSRSTAKPVSAGRHGRRSSQVDPHVH